MNFPDTFTIELDGVKLKPESFEAETVELPPMDGHVRRMPTGGLNVVVSSNRLGTLSGFIARNVKKVLSYRGMSLWIRDHWTDDGKGYILFKGYKAQ